MLPTFADPKTDFVFKRIFGTEAHKHLLIQLLNALLELDGDRRIVDLVYLTPEQSVPLAEMKLSVVDVKCRDERGRTYVVEMQVLNVDAFEKRIVYNTSKAYVMQLPTGEAYRDLCPVVGVTICDFVFWPEPPERGPGAPAAGAPAADDSAAGAPIPMLSRWRMQEQHSGALGLSDVQYVFVELPKYAGGPEPEGTVDRWAYFFREAESLKVVPPMLQESPYLDALEVARTAHFTAQEWDAYDLAKMAEQDARGALILARKVGRQEGLENGLRRSIEDLCAVLGIEWTAQREAQVEAMTSPELEALREHLLTRKSWPDDSTEEPSA